MKAQVAIITGAGSGIGRATAIALGQKGHRLVLCGRRRETLEETAALVGRKVLVISADVTQPADCTRIVERTLGEFGEVHCLVNNAGYAPVCGIEKTTIEDWHAILNTNLSSAFYLSKAIWPTFKKQRGSTIVNISSIAARDPFPNLGAYGAAKAGLNMFSLALAREGADIGVRVYTVAPGAVETGMLRSLFSPEQIPANRALEPADIAKVVVQCVAGDLQYTSGEVIWVHKTM